MSSPSDETNTNSPLDSADSETIQKLLSLQNANKNSTNSPLDLADSETVQQLLSLQNANPNTTLNPSTQQEITSVFALNYTAESGDSIAPTEIQNDPNDYGGGPNQKPDPPESGGFV